MSWQAYLDNTTDGTVYPDWLSFEKAFNAAVAAGSVPPQSQIVLRKAPKRQPVMPAPETVSPPPVVLIPPPSYTVPRLRAQRETQAKANLIVICTVALILGIAFGVYLGVH